MRYVELGAGSQFPYPSHDIDPKLKDADWCRKYAEAAFYDWNYVYPKGVFNNNGGDYEKYRMYALGKQPNSQYKKWLGVDEATNNTWLSIDWSIRAIVSTYRDRAISRLMEQDHQLVATPIDMLAKSELDEWYSNMKAKLAVRQLIQQTNQELSSHPMITLQSDEPMDIEELEMRLENGEQFNRSKDAEMAIQVGLYEGGFKQFRRGIYEDLFDYGVAGYKDWLGDDNKAKYRKVKPDSIGVSYCRNPDFSDMVHSFELIDVPLVELATICDKEGNPVFTEKDLQEFASTISGKWGNPRIMGANTGWLKPYDKFKCKVMDIYFYSYDQYTWSSRKTKENNPVFRQEEYGRGEEGNPRYVRKKFRMVYQCKWVVGTQFSYDWGLMPDQKIPQNPKHKAFAKLPYHFYAYNFHEMKAQGMMERLIPYLDDYQLTMLKIQNFKNRAVPSGWWIDLDALENVALNKGGKNMQPKELLQMFFDTGVLMGRSKDAAGNPMGPNWKPVIPIENTAASELAMFYQDLMTCIQQIEAITGYNDITMGQANPKTLVPGYETGVQSTNHALYPLKFSEQFLSERLGEDILLRMQQGVKKGGISGYAPALNKNLLMFIQISPSIALREYGIMLEESTTNDQKMWLLQQMQADIVNGYLSTADAVTLVNTKNAKQAQQIWAYRVKKAKEIAQQNKMAEIEATNQGNLQSQQAAAQAAMQQKMMEFQFELQKQRDIISGELAKKKMEVDSQERIAMSKNQTTLVEQEMENDGKVEVASITAEAKAVSTVIAGEHAKQKQEIANKKPKPTSSK